MEKIIDGLLDFLNHSHSAFNAAYMLKTILLANEFIEISEKEDYKIKKGNNYFLVRNDNSVLAFKVPKKIVDYRFLISASHLDSPTLKIKMGKENISNGYHRVNVETYGGLIMSSWLDKPLGIAGRVIVKDGKELVSKIIDINKPLLIIPNLCIHFNREINEGYKYNPEVDLKPIISLGKEDNSILKAISDNLKVKEDSIISYDLETYNFTQSTLGGLNNEFLMSPRIDNLESAYLTLEGFLKSEDTGNIKVYVSFNSEEIGSGTLSGADSDLLKANLQRINNLLGYSYNEYLTAIAKSFLLSVDNGHAVHPNHPEVSDLNNLVYLNKGPIIKFNSNMAYLSDGASSSKIINICKENKIQFQIFYNKSDVRGGSTLGTISVSQIGIETCDIGLPQLAMHSSFEVGGAEDVDYMFNLMKSYYSQK